MLDDTATTYYGGHIGKLIKHVTKKKCVCFLYIMHDMAYGFVTYYKK